jgi:hypothetical protein
MRVPYQVPAVRSGAFIVTGSGYTAIEGAILLDRLSLLGPAPDARFFASIAGIFIGPTAGVVGAVLAYVHADRRAVTFPLSEVFNAEAVPKKLQSRPVDITRFVRRTEPTVLTILSRSDPAGGEVDVPTIIIETNPRGTGFS